MTFWNISLFRRVRKILKSDYRGADKSLVRPGRKQLGSMSGTLAISTASRRELSSRFFFFFQGKALKEIHAILTETLACFLPARAKDLSAPLY